MGGVGVHLVNEVEIYSVGRVHLVDRVGVHSVSGVRVYSVGGGWSTLSGCISR